MNPRPQQQRRTAVLGAAAAGVLFQCFHLSEHTVQMAMWVRHPQRAPWMSPWAHEASLRLGMVDPTRSSETTAAAVRGMEYLHLVGNAIFLAGVVALWLLARQHRSARSSAQRALWIQGLHCVEHVALVTSMLAFGRPIGLSTGFGLLAGTRLSTFRVWWHGGVNLLATGACIVAILALRSAMASRPPRHRERRLTGAVVATLGLPLALAFAVGQPAGSASADHDDRHDHDRDHQHDDRDRSLDERDGFHLVDVAAEVGLDVRHSAFRWDVTMDPVAMMGGGVCWIDVDRDGWLDLFLTDTWSDGEWGLWNSAGELPSTRIFRNVEGRFEEYTDTWSAGFETRANGCVAADFDGDGYTDLYVTTARENLLLWNSDGEGFEEGAREAGVAAYGWHTGAAAGDIDGDGRVDLVVAGYADLNSPVTDASAGFPNTFAPIADLVYLNRGTDGRGNDTPSNGGRPTFVDVAADLGIEADGAEYGLGVVLVDVDDDGDLDLYVANDTQPNRLHLTERPGQSAAASEVVTMRDVSAQSGADDPNSGMGIAVGDTNDDARPDLVVTNLAGQGHAVLTTSGIGDDGVPVYGSGDGAAHAAGLDATGWGAAYADFDRNGRLDLLLANGAIPMVTLSSSSEAVTLFCDLGATDATGLTDSSASAGLEAIDARNGRAAALADYDNDGDVDAVISAIGAPLVLLENRGAPGQSITVDPGAPDPGMHVRVELSDGSTIDQWSVIGDGWLSSSDHRVTVAYPDGVAVDQVIVTRSDGREWTSTAVASGTVLRIDPT